MRIFRNAEEVKTFRCLDFRDGYSKRILDPARTSGYLNGLHYNNEFMKIGTRSYSSVMKGHGKISMLLDSNNESILAILRAPNIEGNLYEINSAFLTTPSQLEELLTDILNTGLVLVSQNYFSMDTFDLWKNLGHTYKLEVVTRCGTNHKSVEIELDDAIAYVEDPNSYRNNYQLSLRK